MRPFHVLVIALPATTAWQYSFAPSDTDECHESCFTTTTGAFQTVKSPVWLSVHPLDSFERARLSAVNDTAFEQWYFEAVSGQGDAFIAAFGRDPSYKAFGHGVLPLEMMFAFANGTRHAFTDFAGESTVQDCCGRVQGIWETKTGSVSWEVSGDMKTAKVAFDMHDIKGRAVLKSFTPARYPDGSLWPSKTARTELVPHLSFVEAIPVGDAQVDFTLRGSRLAFSGIGGHFHDIAAFDWFTILDGWQNMRAAVGPFAFSLWNPVSRVEGGVEYQSAVLFKDGEPVATAYGRRGASGRDHDGITIGQHSEGSVHGELGDDSTGWIIEFATPEDGVRWRFTSTHLLVAHEVRLGAGTGLTVFTDSLVGGEVGKDEHTGYGICEQVVLPRSIGPLAAWEVFKTHRDNQGLSTAQAVLRTLKSVSTDGLKSIVSRLLD